MSMYVTPDHVIDAVCGAGLIPALVNPPYAISDPWREREDRRWAENVAIITAVADALGAQVVSSGYYSGNIRVEGVSLRTWIESGRLYVEVDCPSYTDDLGRSQRYQPRTGSNPRISLSTFRTPERIAADIRRRILPQAKELYPAWLKSSQDITARSMTADRFRALLVALKGRETSWREVVDDRRGSRYDQREVSWWAKDFHGDRCKLEINGVSPALAEQIIMLIDEWRDEPKQVQP